jgi:hypothetical protein
VRDRERERENRIHHHLARICRRGCPPSPHGAWAQRSGAADTRAPPVLRRRRTSSCRCSSPLVRGERRGEGRGGKGGDNGAVGIEEGR